jgi:hypothetical protein
MAGSSLDKLWKLRSALIRLCELAALELGAHLRPGDDDRMLPDQWWVVFDLALFGLRLENETYAKCPIRVTCIITVNVTPPDHGA